MALTVRQGPRGALLQATACTKLATVPASKTNHVVKPRALVGRALRLQGAWVVTGKSLIGAMKALNFSQYKAGENSTSGQVRNKGRWGL